MTRKVCIGKVLHLLILVGPSEKMALTQSLPKLGALMIHNKTIPSPPLQATKIARPFISDLKGREEEGVVNKTLDLVGPSFHSPASCSPNTIQAELIIPVIATSHFNQSFGRLPP